MQFSVIVPLYNKSRSIGRAVNSILEQTYEKFEVIVVDDGSTDNGVTVVEDFHDSRIRLVRQNNFGVSVARNKGISIASHQLIAFLDADDAWKPWFLQTITELIKRHPKAYWYATNYERQNKGRKVSGFKGVADNLGGEIDNFFELAVDELPVHISSVVIRRAILDRVGMFPVGVKYGEDQDLFCRLALYYPLIYNFKVCATYFLDSENRTCKKIIVPEVWPFLREYKTCLTEVNLKTSEAIKKFVARRFLTRAKALKNVGRSVEAMQAIAVAELTGTLYELCLKTRKYCNRPMPIIRLIIKYKFYAGRVRGLIRKGFY
ncbi:glycosyltransferase family 2 protein [Desulfobacterota bacterium M19]